MPPAPSVHRKRGSALSIRFFGILIAAICTAGIAAAQDAPAPAETPPAAEQPPAETPPPAAEQPPAAVPADPAPASPAAAPAKPAEDVLNIKLGYLKQEVERLLPTSRLDYLPADHGIAGAQVGLNDNNTTGRFMKQSFTMETEVVPPKGDAVAALNKLVEGGAGFILVDAPAEVLLKLADAAKGKDVVLFNLSAHDDGLRGEHCRVNVVHTALSHNQMTDAIAQYLIWKKWNRWFLISGKNPNDVDYANAVKRSAKKFGGQIVEERVYDRGAGSRGTDSGYEQVQQQMPLFTQSAPSHHVVFAADESDIFGLYLPYRTWDPRPVVGTAGMVATSWHPSMELWGGTQLNTRFEKFSKRYMTPLDYNAWVAVRSVGEAAIRDKTGDTKKLRDYMLSDRFGLAAFKGQNVSYRSWNNQLRSPIILADQKLPVSVSPQPGFLHQKAEVDSLGIDEPESKCSF